MGMQLAGRVGSDASVLAMGQAWHEATDWPNKRPPVL
jgi:amidase